MFDFVAFFPFYVIVDQDILSHSIMNNLYVLKMIRLPHGLSTFDADEWFKYCSDYF